MIKEIANTVDIKPSIETGGFGSEMSKSKLDISKPIDFSRPDELGKCSAKNELDIRKEQDYSKEQEKDKLDRLKKDYINDVLDKSEFPETIDLEKVLNADFKKCSPEETGDKRAEFNRMKSDLRTQWAEANGRPWPCYEQNVYDEKGNCIRQVGGCYDAHHLQPLSMGGKNEVSNITPLSADVHYDAKGVHQIGSPFNELEKCLQLK